MTKDTKSARSRWLVRASAVSLGIALGSVAAPAMAAPPEAWGKVDNGSVLHNLLWLVGTPILVCLILTLLVYLPSMMRKHSSEPGGAFRDRPEWFGGPRKGVDATDGVGESDKGGAGARW
jgi:hypothetical protein